MRSRLTDKFIFLVIGETRVGVIFTKVCVFVFFVTSTMLGQVCPWPLACGCLGFVFFATSSMIGQRLRHIFSFSTHTKKGMVFLLESGWGHLT